jgi:hypothetical protein
MPDTPDHVTGLKALVEALGNADLAKQVYADANAADRHTAKDHFEARLEFVRQKAQHSQTTEAAIKEYGLQTLKWLFLLNAGAIGLVLAYIAGKLPGAKAENVGPILRATAPFALGCVCVVLSGASGFLNFSYGHGSLPSPEALHTFLNPSTLKWPAARMQVAEEAPIDFHKRFVSKMGLTRNLAVGLAIASGGFFITGVICMLIVT